MLTVAAATVILLIAIMLDADHFKFMVYPEIQAIAGVLVVAVLLFDNVVSGLVLGISVLIMYARVYSNQYGINWGNQLTGKKMNSALSSAVKKYITPQDLEDAQNNIVSKKAYETPVIGMSGVYGETVYGAQGFAEKNVMPGYDSYAPGSAVKA